MLNVLRVGTDFNERRVGLSVSKSSKGLSKSFIHPGFDILVDRFGMKMYGFCFIHIYIYIYKTIQTCMTIGYLSGKFRHDVELHLP